MGDERAARADSAVPPAEQAAMARALEIAAYGPAHGPNPRVGCVLLDVDGRAVAEGWHAGAGTPHAEAAAVATAKAHGLDLTGCTAVVTLEPCAHTGRTGPCTEVLLAAGIARVLHAVDDPDPLASGGADLLRARGVAVVGGVDRPGGEELLRVWLHAVRSGRPFVTLKAAASLDGRVAAADGSSRWITSAESRAHAHRIRGEVDAIAVGTGTALTDDPSLTARTPEGELDAHQPLRVVVGRRAIPPGARLHGPGGDLVQLATHDVAAVLQDLAAREVRHLLVEGGPGLAGAFWKAGVVDEVHAYLAPLLLGSGPTVVPDLGVRTLGEARRMTTVRTERLGADVLLVARPHGRIHGARDPADEGAADPTHQRTADRPDGPSVTKET